ncbi:MAG: polysaccharide biosynthesis protein [Clostridia bacterium]|nr:polysaccharide biosynthesis protein [Clostridia bacterium]
MGKLKKSSFLEGAFIATICIVISKVLGILYVIPFNHIIGERGGALYGYAYNIYNIFLTISSVGIPFAIAKLTSEYATLGQTAKKLRMYRLATVAILVFSVVSFAVCFFAAEPLAKLIISEITEGNTINDVTFAIRCISFTLLIVPLLSIKRGYLQGHKFISQPSLSQVVEQLIRIIIILVGSSLFIYVIKGNAHKAVNNAVGISVLAAGIGGLIAYLYLTVIVQKNRSQLDLNQKFSVDRSMDKEILREIILCALPFIIINLANTLYNTTDMILVLHTLPKLGFTGSETEFVSSVFTTWGTKFNAIITAVSTGLIVSLIPHMVSDYTAGNHQAVNDNFNKCLKIILLIILPLSLFISLMGNSFWTVFYGKSTIGPRVIRYSILVTGFDCLYMVLNSLMQSLNKKRVIYLSVFSGLLANLLLDIPLMHLFKHLGGQAYHGAITATLIGFLISNGMSLWYLRRNMNVRYGETLRALPRVLLSVLVLVALGIGFNYLLPVTGSSRLVQIGILAASGIVMGGVHLVLNYRAILSVLPEKLAGKLPKSLR